MHLPTLIPLLALLTPTLSHTISEQRMRMLSGGRFGPSQSGNNHFTNGKRYFINPKPENPAGAGVLSGIDPTRVTSNSIMDSQSDKRDLIYPKPQTPAGAGVITGIDDKRIPVNKRDACEFSSCDACYKEELACVNCAKDYTVDNFAPCMLWS
ncbi:hypothetical protein QC761_609420 [Podospora bellae-mahoneyi]|uniref:Secreted protein n=1 Tax=Podospora bellae-mahoneyi TaxID=2093777 RepID=A0ABR0FEE1_9PEZI|nr:hypothetical protein QC761_609420 [Podospora bellae-mahoneyi]